MTKDLLSVPGKEATAITVDYPPGGADPVHRHNASAFVYVLEGSMKYDECRENSPPVVAQH